MVSMVTLKKISLGEIRPLISLAYEGDNDLFEKYSIVPLPYEDCVNLQMIQIKQAAQEVECNYYKAVYNKKVIGYVVTFKDVLYSFAVGMAYRKKEILQSFFEGIKKALPEKFGCVLYKKNTRAIEYLQKCGMLISEQDMEPKSVTLVKV